MAVETRVVKAADGQALNPDVVRTWVVEKAKRDLGRQNWVDVSNLTDEETVRVLNGEPIDLRPLTSALHQAVGHILHPRLPFKKDSHPQAI